MPGSEGQDGRVRPYKIWFIVQVQECHVAT